MILRGLFVCPQVATSYVKYQVAVKRKSFLGVFSFWWLIFYSMPAFQ